MPIPKHISKHSLLVGASLAALAPVWAQEAEAPSEEDARQLETVVVRGQFIPDEKRSTSEVSSLIDADDFQIQGDGDAAAALARVAGISTAQNKFVYVRGLNERYSSALLNGSPLPSPAPLRRVAPLDLFPTSALESILVQKTYSPDLPGEFGGGLVDIRTKGLPDEGFFKVSLGAALDTETSLIDGLLYDGSDTDIFGFDDGARDLPIIDENFGLELTDNSSLLVMQKGQISPNFDVGLTGGTRFDLTNDVSLGFIASAGYSNSWTSRTGIRGFAFTPSQASDEIAADERRERKSTENTVSTDLLISTGVELYDDHELNFTGLITRSSEKEARTVLGSTQEDAGIFRDDSLEWFERQLWTTQLNGKHYFPSLMDLEVEWRGSYSEALRDAPYQVSNRYLQLDDGSFRLQSSPAANRFLFSKVDDDTTDFGIDFTLPFISDAGDCTYFCEFNLKGGYSYVENDRSAFSRQFDVSGVGAIDGEGVRLDFIYNALFNGGGGSVAETGGIIFPEAYLATLEVDAAYAGLDFQVTPFIRAAIGGRFESAIQAVDTFALDSDPALNFVESCIERQEDLSCDSKEDFLPAVTITWNPLDDLQVRFGYSQTLTRPQFRELAPTQFVNTETDESFVGNPFLQNSEITNYDVRGEYYFSRGQFVTLGFFYKDMINPIEEVLEPFADSQVVAFINVPAAELYGFEVEYEQVLPVHDWFGGSVFEDKDFTVKTNYTWSDSEVDAEGLTVVNGGTPVSPVASEVLASGRVLDGRRLQGQSEHLFNLQFGVSDEEDMFEANLLLNFASERIRTAEFLTRSLPAIVEKPPVSLDFVMNKQFEIGSGFYELSLNIENLLGDGYEAFQEGGGVKVDVDTYDIGTVFALGLKREF